MKRDYLNSAHGKRAMKAMIKKKTILRLVLGSLLLALPACQNLTSPNFNFADVDDLLNNPTRASIQTAAQGLMIGNRAYYGTGPNDMISALGMLGRESYNHDTADPRFEGAYLRGPLDPSENAFGGNYWQEPYANIKLGSIVLLGVDALSDAGDVGFTPGD